MSSNEMYRRAFASALALALTATVVDAKPPGKRLPPPANDADYYQYAGSDGYEAKVALGKALFFDKLLSGNRNISCATCHHPLAGTGDGLSLPVGEGGRGLGVTRDTGTGADAVHERVPRNAPFVFNLGHESFTVMFHDGRVEVLGDGSFRNPAGGDLPPGHDNILAVQAMFPVTSATEMAGQLTDLPAHPDNEIAPLAAAPADLPGIWNALAARLRDPSNNYVDLFKAAFADIDDATDISYVHAANAIAAFEADAWRADDSPFDRYLRGDKHALSKAARKGMKLFYGKAGCVSCHSGTFQTDNAFHAIAMPQIGAGKGDGPDGRDDFGRERVTLDPADRYRFRTPSLRNTAITGPWGHDGAYDSLEAVVRHHLDPAAAIHAYDAGVCAQEPMLPHRPDLDAKDCVVQSDWTRREAIAMANELAPVSLSDDELAAILEFLHALTDRDGLDMRADVPRSVPSGLPVAD